MGKKLEYSLCNKDTLKSVVFSVLEDKHMKSDLGKVRELIKEAPGNKGAAEMIVGYYKKVMRKAID